MTLKSILNFVMIFKFKNVLKILYTFFLPCHINMDKFKTSKNNIVFSIAVKKEKSSGTMEKVHESLGARGKCNTTRKKMVRLIRRTEIRISQFFPPAPRE